MDADYDNFILISRGMINPSLGDKNGYSKFFIEWLINTLASVACAVIRCLKYSWWNAKLLSQLCILFKLENGLISVEKKSLHDAYFEKNHVDMCLKP